MPLPGNLTEKLRRPLALLGGLCFFLSAMEYMVPKPLPFIRLGLANLPLLLALDILPFPFFMLLALLKTAGQGLITGTLFSYVLVFSLGGTCLSALVMFALHRGLGKARISLVGISVAGAFASNMVQLILARYLIFGDSIRYAAVPILGFGIITGAILGCLCEYFLGRSRWYDSLYKSVHYDRTPDGAGKGSPRETEFSSKPADNFTPNLPTAGEEAFARYFALAGLSMAPALLLNPSTQGRIIQCLFFILLARLSGRKINLPLTITVSLGIVLFNLLVPYGELLLSLGPLRITYGALDGGIRRAITLAGLLALSRFSVRRNLALPGLFGRILSQALKVFSSMGEKKSALAGQNWADGLDHLLLDLDREQNNPEAGEGAYENVPGITPPVLPRPLYLPVIIILAWLPLILPVIIRG